MAREEETGFELIQHDPVFVGTIEDDKIYTEMREYVSTLPPGYTGNVGKIHYIDSPGHSFQAGGQTFTSGGHYDPITRDITINEINKKTADDIQYLITHEYGHNFMDNWWDAANKAGDVGPLAEARDDFLRYFKEGQEITPYASAWAKDGKFSETVAEIAKIYAYRDEEWLMNFAKEQGSTEMVSAVIRAIKALK
jgi:hypothetical protein